MDQSTILSALIDSGLAHCVTVATDNGGLLAALFGAGLVGGLSHCAGMCGPFVLSQVAARQSRIPAADMRDFHRLTGASLLPYHLGRATTYMFLGAAAAMLAGSLIDGAGVRWLSAGLLLLAALLFLGYGLERAGLGRLVGRAPRGSSGAGWWSRYVGGIARPLFDSPRGGRGYLLGILLGFIPCGLLYGALTAASASGDPLAGAFAMAAFAAGTAPALFAVGLFGSLAALRWRTATARLGPVLMIANAGFLTLLAWRWVA